MMRFSTMVLSLLLLASVSAFGQGMQKGDFQADQSSEGWTLASGTGTRSHIVFVSFDKAFTSTPTVMVALTGYDGVGGKDGTMRVALKPEKITKEGFVVKVQTWADSRVNGVFGSWIAWAK